MTEERILVLKSKLSSFKIELIDVNGTPGVIIPKENLLEVCKILKNDNELLFDQLVDAIGVDRFTKKDRFEVIYNLRSVRYKDRLFIKVKVDANEPNSPSLVPIWGSANWYEREAYDMVGVEFTDHPDLRRMYMPEDFEYHPLRKDFPLMGIPGSLPLPNK